MPHNVIQGKNGDWYHFHEINESDFQYLKDNFKFHPLDYEDVRSESPISKMDVYKHYVFAVFHIPTVNNKTGQVYGEALYVFVSQDHLVTITNGEVPAVDRLWKEAREKQEAGKDAVRRGPAFLMYEILHDAFRDAVPIVSELSKEVHRSEDLIHQGGGRKVTMRIGEARRNVLFIRHIIDPQRRMLTTLASLQRYFLSKDLKDYFDDVRDLIDSMWLSSNNLKLIIDGLFDVNEAMMTHKTNRVITLLTVVTAALTGPTLVAGFYGMNAEWLPGASDPTFVGWAFFLSFIVIPLIVALALKRR